MLKILTQPNNVELYIVRSMYFLIHDYTIFKFELSPAFIPYKTTIAFKIGIQSPLLIYICDFCYLITLQQRVTD